MNKKFIILVIAIITTLGCLIALANYRHSMAKKNAKILFEHNYNTILKSLPTNAQKHSEDGCSEGGSGLSKHYGCGMSFDITFDPPVNDQTSIKQVLKNIMDQGYTLETDETKEGINTTNNKFHEYYQSPRGFDRAGRYDIDYLESTIYGKKDSSTYGLIQTKHDLMKINFHINYQSNCDHGIQAILLPCSLDKILF
jgi:hypothetical protein